MKNNISVMLVINFTKHPFQTVTIIVYNVRGALFSLCRFKIHWISTSGIFSHFMNKFGRYNIFSIAGFADDIQGLFVNSPEHHISDIGGKSPKPNKFAER